jgi:hypothetical protein
VLPWQNQIAKLVACPTQKLIFVGDKIAFLSHPRYSKGITL